MNASAHPLDDVIWNALAGVHAPLARGDDRARRYRPEIAPFAAMREDSDEARAALAALADPGEQVVTLGAPDFDPGPAFEVQGAKELVQMVCGDLRGQPRDLGRFVPLGDGDIAQMLSLVELTQPGPFRERTIDFGGFRGHKPAGRLVAMGGRRMQLDGFTEVSGICTLPEYRGQGLARDLVLMLSRELLESGKTPFLHAFSDNGPAIALYEQLGYVIRARPHVIRLRRRG